ncbi:sterol-binding protein [Chromatium okenii]|uniref:SCP2 sterol-binding domain-containing protein n=1 Tax=Chromatium okenii TaxID=61644 RepID=UPI001908FF7D|nr:sterol-binding protein [Chromatium okenii]
MNEGIQLPDALLAVLEQAINRYIALDAEHGAGFAALTGRLIAIELNGFGTRITVIPNEQGLQLFGDYDAQPDCLIRGTPLGLARLGMGDGKNAQLIAGEVEISGDTALAQAFNTAIAALDVDWEEQLAQVIGDPFAQQVGKQCRANQQWQERTAAQMTAQLKAYLQREQGVVPTRHEVEAFLAQVDLLRDDCERLAARVERLTQHAAVAGLQL